MRRIGVTVALLGWATSASAASGGPWQAAAPFKLSPTANRCIAVGDFSRGNQKMQVALETRPTGHYFELRLYAPGSLRRWDDGKYSLGGAKLESDVVVVRSSSQKNTMIYRLGTNRTELGAAGSNPTLKLREILNPGDVALSGLDHAVQLLDTCTADLIDRWGYSKQFQRALASPPKPRNAWDKYVSSEDYPILSIYSRSGGESHLLIDVNPDGRGSNCRVMMSSGHDELDQMSCRIMTDRAQYEPGRNITGQAVQAPYFAVFRWEIPSPNW